MSSSLIVPLIILIIWVVIGAIVPWFIPKGPNKGIIQTMLVTTAVSCFALWICTYIAQLNPLFGPQISNVTLMLMQNGF